MSETIEAAPVGGLSVSRPDDRSHTLIGPTFARVIRMPRRISHEHGWRQRCSERETYSRGNLTDIAHPGARAPELHKLR
jgi:hypothetical protein